MKPKLLIFLALMFCMGAFFFPNSVQAASNAAPPVVSASITGNALNIEVTDGFFGVEAVYINEKRFNYRVDDALIVDARVYVGGEKLSSVYAVDFAGNKSNMIWLDNPFYSAPMASATTVELETPPKPFTPDGQASVVDQATEADGKDFYTFSTQAGNVFHLIIDHQRTADNVYFLNAITENDLQAIAEKSENTGVSAIPEPTATPEPEKPAGLEKPVEPEPPPAAPAPENNNSMLVIVLIGVLAVGGAAYYIKIVRPRQQGVDVDEDDDNEYTDDEPDEVGEEPDNE